MAGKVRRFFGCLGIVAVIVVVVVLVSNFGLAWHYRRGAAAIEQEMAAKGYPATFDEVLARQAVPEGTHNGADDLLAALESFSDENADYGLLPAMGNTPLSPDDPISEESLREIQKILEVNRTTLEGIASGVRAEQFRLPLRATGLISLLPDGFGRQVRTCARLVRLQSLYAGHSGDSAGALDSVETLLRLGDRLMRQPDLSAYFNGSTIQRMACDAADDLMERGYVKSTADLDRLAESFASASTGDLATVVWADALTEQELLDAEVRSSIQEAEQEGASFGAWFVRAAFFVYSNLFVYELDGLLQRELGMAAAKSLDDPVTPATMQRLDDVNLPGPPLRYALLSASPIGVDVARKFPYVAAVARARLRTVAVATRVMRYRTEQGHFPDAAGFSALADEVRDPVGGAPLLYRSDETEFAVYSVGQNGRDDDGVFLGPKKKTDDIGVSIQLPRSN